jgi:hypothetical protein
LFEVLLTPKTDASTLVSKTVAVDQDVPDMPLFFEHKSHLIGTPSINFENTIKSESPLATSFSKADCSEPTITF